MPKVELEPDTHERLRELRRLKGIVMGHFVEQAIREKLERDYQMNQGKRAKQETPQEAA